MEPIPYSHIEKGSLLIASPEIDEGIYFRSIVLICEHSPSGSLGLIINKPLEMELPEEILDLNEIANHKIELCSGGPIQPSQMLLLHSSDQVPDDTLKVADNIYLGGDLQFLRDAAQDANGPAVRLCFGYGAWGPGQIEHEFLNGEWFLHPASPKLVFDIPAAKMWQTILREMGGKFAALSMMPEDLSLN